MPSDSLARSCEKNIIKFLHNNQCILDQFRLSPDVLEEVTLIFTRSGEPYCFRPEILGSTMRWISPQGKVCSAKEGQFFRLNPFEGVSQLPGVDEVRTSIASKCRSRLESLCDQIAKIYRHFRMGGFDVDTKGLLSDLMCCIFSRNFPKGGGFMCRWRRDGKNVVVDVIDHGGILDDNPNVEGKAAEPQVMTNYYADGYAAYLFLREFQRTGDEAFLESGLANLQFLIRTYEGYPMGMTWMHHEFKNPAFIECLELLKRLNRLPQHFEEFLDVLRLDRYEPTNVFALRYYWKALLCQFGGRCDAKRIEACRNRLVRDQTCDGLIMDNNPPMYRAARDLTYHQYSLACLAGALESGVEDKTILDIFLKGCSFSKDVMLDNGEVSYNGRGANNVYHIASAVYAFTVAHRLFGFKVGPLDRMIERLTEFALVDGSLPTGLNAYANERMAWNHCRTPYNALSGFLISKACDLGLPESGDTAPSLHRLEIHQDSGYGIYRSPDFEATVFSGLGESYIYSGAHRTGVSGLAVFLPRGGRPMNLILDRSLRDHGSLVSDLPIVLFNGHLYEPLVGALSLTSSGFAWGYENEYFGLQRNYKFFDSGVCFTDKIFCKACGRLEVPTAFCWPLNSSAYSHRLEGSKVRFYPQDQHPGIWSLDCQDCLAVEWVVREIISNPRGRGKLVTRRLDARQVSKGQHLTWTTQLTKE